MPQRSEPVRSPRRPGTRIMALVAACLALTAVAPAATADDGPKLESDIERLSYMIGFQIGQNLIGQGLDRVDVQALALALEDALRRQAPRLTNEEMAAVWSQFQAAREANQAHDAARNLEIGRQFLASNAKNDGVVEMPTGLQYRILRSGEGPKPGSEDEVVVHYQGRLLDGTEFDSSYRRGEPARFAVGGVIPGWQLALKAMPAGSRWEVWIPAELAYGERGAGRDIGPNQTLHFEIELIEVNPGGNSGGNSGG